jgi:hypothetical protein
MDMLTGNKHDTDALTRTTPLHDISKVQDVLTLHKLHGMLIFFTFFEVEYSFVIILRISTCNSLYNFSGRENVMFLTFLFDILFGQF